MNVRQLRREITEIGEKDVVVRAPLNAAIKEYQMAVIGTHMLFYTSEPAALRAMLRDAFGLKHVDAGEGWLIFRLPPSEIGVHPSEGPAFESGIRHQISFMCDDIRKTITELRGKGVDIKGEPSDQGWGITAMMDLPGGCQVMLYEPRHPVAIERGDTRRG